MCVVLAVVYLVMGRVKTARCLIFGLLRWLWLPLALINLEVVCLVIILVNLWLLGFLEVLYY